MQNRCKYHVQWKPHTQQQYGFLITIFHLFHSFYGMDVNMTWFPLPPYWMPVSGSTSDNFMGSSFAGRDVIIIETIARTLNFSIHLVPYRGTENVWWLRTVVLNLGIRKFAKAF